ncbi:MAG: SDR family NAD(P)-dependent oxidoreductase [Saprospiraceae bacterium]
MPETFLITGGSSGIGLALAHHAAKAGHRLILAALPGQELEDAGQSLRASYPGIDLHLCPTDLTRPEGPDEVYAFTQSRHLDVDVLVNNAGVGTWGRLHTLDPEKEVKMIELNILALYKLTRLYLTPMQERQAGHILFIASIAAFQPNPYMATYGATKAFVRSFGLALYHELKDQGSAVRVTTVCPPAIPTAFQRVAGMERSALFSGWLASDVASVAAAAWKGYQQKSPQVIPSRVLSFLQPFIRLLPESWSIWMARRTLRQNLPE